MIYLCQITCIKSEFDQAQSELNLARSKMKERDSQISAMSREQENLQSKISDANLERKRMENEVHCSIMDLSYVSLKVIKKVLCTFAGETHGNGAKRLFLKGSKAFRKA